MLLCTPRLQPALVWGTCKKNSAQGVLGFTPSPRAFIALVQLSATVVAALPSCPSGDVALATKVMCFFLLMMHTVWTSLW